MMKLADGGGIDGKMKKKPCNRGDALFGGEEICKICSSLF